MTKFYRTSIIFRIIFSDFIFFDEYEVVNVINLKVWKNSVFKKLRDLTRKTGRAHIQNKFVRFLF